LYASSVFVQVVYIVKYTNMFVFDMGSGSFNSDNSFVQTTYRLTYIVLHHYSGQTVAGSSVHRTCAVSRGMVE